MPLVALSLVSLVALAHVPSYGGSSGCVRPEHPHTTSQAVYLKGPGGLEILIADDHDPFHTDEGEMIDIDVVFRDNVPLTDFKLFVGCGTCDLDVVNIAPMLVVTHIGEGKVEPFSQHAYRHALHGAQRKFNSSVLDPTLCPEKRFTIRLEQQVNAPEIYWSAVVGLGEQFTFAELLSFPLYVYRNHGSAWNELGWTIWVIFLLTAVARPIYLLFRLWQLDDEKAFDSYRVEYSTKSAQVILFELATISFVATGLELFVHLLYAQGLVPAGGEFWIGFFFVVLIPNAFGVWVAWSAWRDAIQSANGTRKWVLGYLVAGLVLFLVFGAGFFLGPSALVLGSLLWTVRSDDTVAANARDAPRPVVDRNKVLVPLLLIRQN